jgi:ATP-binding cassette subfamily C (CFTR/MRP) protein 1
LNPQDQFALDNINISIQAGEKVAIVGRTGRRVYFPIATPVFKLTLNSGKSSLVLLLLRLLDPLPSNTSRILIDGVNVETLNRRSLRNCLVTIPQDSFLHGQLTWQQNLQAGHGSTLEECESVLMDVNLLDPIRRSGGLDATAKPEILSHGQKQLFGLARAVLKSRQRAKLLSQRNSGGTKAVEQVPCGGILLLDEISSSVDEGTEATMHEIIMREFKEYTIIAVAHRLNSVKDFDTVIVMEGGKVKERGPARYMLAILEASAAT